MNVDSCDTSCDGVIFDWGGVVAGNVSSAFSRVELVLGLPEGSLPHIFGIEPYESDQDNVLHEFELGRATLDDWAKWMFERAERLYGVRIGPDALNTVSQHVMAGLQLNDAVVEAITALGERGVPTALCTNNLPGVDSWREAAAELSFDVVVASSEVSMRKPDRAIFELVCNRLGTAPARTVFLDDIEANIRGASASGLLVVLVDDPAHAVATMWDLLDGLRSEHGGPPV